MNPKAAKAKYAQLRIQERALDKQIDKEEAKRPMDSTRLSDLYRQRTTVRNEIQQMLGQF